MAKRLNYIGVERTNDGKKWQVTVDGKQPVGLYKTASAAAHAYDKLAAEKHGDKATLNFPKRKKRSSLKYPMLDKSVNSKARQELLDYDYVDKLNEKEKGFLNKFSSEFIGASFDKDRPNLISSKEEQLSIYRDNNRRNNDVLTKARIKNVLYELDSAKDVTISNEDVLIEFIDQKEAVKKVRTPFENVYMALAHMLSSRSTCKRLNVGTVITSTDFRKVLSVGYNGNATGLDNCCDREEEGNCGCLHSEENAIINCDSPRFVEKVVFVTHLPCPMCAKRIINLGNVKQIYYAKNYRIKESRVLFKRACIKIDELNLDI